jgi:hypothetical protein
VGENEKKPTPTKRKKGTAIAKKGRREAASEVANQQRPVDPAGWKHEANPHGAAPITASRCSRLSDCDVYKGVTVL